MIAYLVFLGEDGGDDHEVAEHREDRQEGHDGNLTMSHGPYIRVSRCEDQSWNPLTKRSMYDVLESPGFMRGQIEILMLIFLQKFYISLVTCAKYNTHRN
jgi:hypothetical protein